MVQELHVDELCKFLDVIGECLILCARITLPTRVVVTQDQTCGGTAQCLLKNTLGISNSAVPPTDAQLCKLYDFIRKIQIQHKELFVIEVGELNLE